MDRNMFPEEPQDENNENVLAGDDEGENIDFGDSLEDFEDLIGTDSEGEGSEGSEDEQGGQDESGHDGNEADGADPGDAEDQDADAGGEPAKEKWKWPEFVIDNRRPSGIARGIGAWCRAVWRTFGKRGKIILTSSAAAFVALLIIFVVILNTSPFVRTYSALDELEAAEITHVLDTQRIRYDRVRYDDGIAIYVREVDQARATAALMDEGHWFRGFVFEEDEDVGGLFDTSDVIRERMIANRQRRLAGVLGAMPGVVDAVVTLVVPDNDRIVLAGDMQPSTASVMLVMRDGAYMSDDSVRSIENLLMHSVQGLDTEHITITGVVDGVVLQLNVFEEDEVDENLNFISMLEIKRNFERELEREYEERARRVLQPLFSDVEVAVTVRSDFNRFLREATHFLGANFDEETGEIRGMVAAEGIDRILSSAADNDNIWGVVGTDGNVDPTGYYETPLDTELGNFMDALHITREILVDQISEIMERTTPEITSITLAANANGTMYEEDQEALIMLLANATGITEIAMAHMTDEEDVFGVEHLEGFVSLYVGRWWTPPPTVLIDPLPAYGHFTPFELWLALGGGLIFAVMLAVLLIAIAKRAKRYSEEDEMEEEFVEYYGPDGLHEDPELDAFAMAIGQAAVADEMDIDDEEEGEMSLELKEEHLKTQIKGFVDQNPEIAAQLIKTLMKGDERSG